MSRIKTASATCALDSNLVSGGGTNDTAALQALLNQIESEGGGVLELDGVALVTGLDIGTNTHLRCLPGCGLFLASGSNRPIIANKTRYTLGQRNAGITITDLTANCNGANQAQIESGDHFVVGFEFIRVDGLLLRRITLLNPRTFGVLFGDYSDLFISRLKVIQSTPGQNQDAWHVWGPGKGILVVEDTWGNGDDDTGAICADEMRGLADAANETFGDIDGAVILRTHCEGANQGIRLLSQQSRIGPVKIDGVTGTIGSYAVHVGNQFDLGPGNFANVTIDHVDVKLRAAGNRYVNANNWIIPTWNVVNVHGRVEVLKISGLNMADFGDQRPAVAIGSKGNIRSLILSECTHNNPDDAWKFLAVDPAAIVDEIQSNLAATIPGPPPPPPGGLPLKLALNSSDAGELAAFDAFRELAETRGLVVVP